MLVNTYQGFSISFVTGTPGSGKSYIMTRDVLRRLLETKVRVITNLPLNVAVISETLAKQLQCEPEEIAERIVLIDSATLARWKTPDTAEEDGKEYIVVHGPWEWPEDMAKGSELILDECHLFCPKEGEGSRTYAKMWRAFLGEARHLGWHRIVFITQDESKVGKSIESHAELRYEMTNAERMRDPFFKIPMGHWFELVASWTGQFKSYISLIEYRRSASKLRVVHAEKYVIDPYFFQFYSSHSAAGGGSVEGQIDRPLREFEKRPRLWSTRDEKGRKVRPVWQWFLGLHWYRFTLAGAAACVVAWLCFFGGINYLMTTAAGVASRKAKSTANSPDLAPLPGGDVKVVKSQESAEVKGLRSSLPAAMAAVPPEHRAAIEEAMTLAAEELRKRDQEILELQTAKATPVEEPESPLPVVSGFIRPKYAMVQGRKVAEGDVIHFNGGKRRVKIRKIDQAERTVILEDARVLRFAEYSDDRVPVPGSIPFNGIPSPAAATFSASLQSLGQQATGEPGQAAARENSIVVRRGNAGDGVRPALGGRSGSVGGGGRSAGQASGLGGVPGDVAGGSAANRSASPGNVVPDRGQDDVPGAKSAGGPGPDGAASPPAATGAN